MYMTIEGMEGTGVDEEDADAFAIAHWCWGMYEDGAGSHASPVETYDLTVVRELDQASTGIRLRHLHLTPCPDVCLYEYRGTGANRSKASLVKLKDVRIVYYTRVDIPDQEPAEIFGLRFMEASIVYASRM